MAKKGIVMQQANGVFNRNDENQLSFDFGEIPKEEHAGKRIGSVVSQHEGRQRNEKELDTEPLKGDNKDVTSDHDEFITVYYNFPVWRALGPAESVLLVMMGRLMSRNSNIVDLSTSKRKRLSKKAGISSKS